MADNLTSIFNPSAIISSAVGGGGDANIAAGVNLSVAKAEESFRKQLAEDLGIDDSTELDARTLLQREQCFLVKSRDILAKEVSQLTPGISYTEVQQSNALSLMERASGGESVSWLDGSYDLWRNQFDNFAIVSANDPTTLFEKFIIPSGMELLFNLRPAQLAAIIPKLKIYLRKYGQDGKSVDQPLIFDEYLRAKDVAQITANRAGRGQGAGIKTFQWTWLPTSGHESDKDLRAKLTLKFLNLEDFAGDDFAAAMQMRNEMNDKERLFKDLTVTNFQIRRAKNYSHEMSRSSARFTDLIPEMGYPGIDKEIKIVTGWSVPTNMNSLFSAKELKAIKICDMTLLMAVVGYSLDIAQDGQISLEITLQGRTEAVMATSYADMFLLANDIDLPEELQRLANVPGLGAIKYVKDKKGNTRVDGQLVSNGVPQSFEDFQEAIMNLYGTIRQLEEEKLDIINKRGQNKRVTAADCKRYADIEFTIRMLRITDEKFQNTQKYLKYSALPVLLLKTARIYSVAFDKSYLGTLSPDESAFKVSKLRYRGDELTNLGADFKAIKDGTAVRDDDIIRINEIRINEDMYTMNFFYLGDLLGVLFRVLYKNCVHFQNLRILLGPVLLDPESGSVLADNVVNLADIPISYHNFMVWYYDRVVRTNKDSYPVRDFIKELLNELIAPTLFDCVSDPRQTKIDLFASHFFIASNDPSGADPIVGVKNPDDLSGQRLQVDNFDLATRKAAGDDSRYTFEYLLFHASQYIASAEADPVKDAKRGIMHLRLGSEAGLVKKIEFMRDDLPEGDAYRTLTGDVLSYIYKTKVILYGNPLFVPGQTVYIDRKLVGRGNPAVREDLAKMLGIGGYHMVSKVQTTIEQGGAFETHIETYPSDAWDHRLASKYTNSYAAENAQACRDAIEEQAKHADEEIKANAEASLAKAEAKDPWYWNDKSAGKEEIKRWRNNWSKLRPEQQQFLLDAVAKQNDEGWQNLGRAVRAFSSEEDQGE